MVMRCDQIGARSGSTPLMSTKIKYMKAKSMKMTPFLIKLVKQKENEKLLKEFDEWFAKLIKLNGVTKL